MNQIILLGILISISSATYPPVIARLTSLLPKLKPTTLHNLIKGFKLNHKLKSAKFFDQLSTAHLELESSKQRIRNEEQKLGKLYSLYEKLEAQNIANSSSSKRELSFEQKYRSQSLNDLIFRVKRNLTERQMTLISMRRNLAKLAEKTKGLVLSRRLFFSNNFKKKVKTALFLHLIGSQLESNRHLTDDESDDIRQAAENAVFGSRSDGVDENSSEDETSQDDIQTDSQNEEEKTGQAPLAEEQPRTVEIDDGLQTEEQGNDQPQSTVTETPDDTQSTEVNTPQENSNDSVNEAIVKTEDSNPDTNNLQSKDASQEVNVENNTESLDEQSSLEEKGRLRNSLIDDLEKTTAPNVYVQCSEPQSTTSTEEAAKISLILQKDSLTNTDEKSPIKFDLSPLLAPVDDSSNTQSSQNVAEDSKTETQADKKPEPASTDSNTEATVESKDETQTAVIGQPASSSPSTDDNVSQETTQIKSDQPKEPPKEPTSISTEHNQTPIEPLQTQPTNKISTQSNPPNQNSESTITTQTPPSQPKTPSITETLFTGLKQFQNFIEDTKAQKQVVNKLEQIVDNLIDFTRNEVKATLSAVEEGYASAKPVANETPSRNLSIELPLTFQGKTSMHFNPKMEQLRPFLSSMDRNVHMIVPKSNEK
jgi:hypothetical protein